VYLRRKENWEERTMGGFMINGIGAADSFKPIQDLGEYYCNYCKKNRIFSLMAIKRKIRVVYIPTLTVTTKHGITCKNCKTIPIITN